jgi:tetratricopeptide repeat protein
VTLSIDMKHLGSWIAACAMCLCIAAHAQGVRPEVGKPLQQASDLLKAGKAKEALAKAREADAVSGKTPAEQVMIDRMKGAAAQRAGDNATAIQAFEAVFNSGKLSAAEQAQVAESLAFAFSQQKDWPRTNQWVQRAIAAGSTSPQLKQLQAYAQSQSGDYSAIAKEAQAAVAAAEQAGRKPDEGDLLRLADAQQRTGNTQGRAATLDKLLVNYPKKEYWSILLGQLPRKSGFSDRLSLDLFRLRLATGNLTKTDDFMEMAQLALQAGYPAEGRAVIDKGFASGALGTGAEGERHKRLRDLAIKQEAEGKTGIEKDAQEALAAKGGDELVRVGYTYVTMGQVDKGIATIEQGIAKGGLKRPEDAKLHLGLAQLQSGKNKGKAVQTLRSVQGNDGAADLGRLWAVYANQSP